MCLGRPPSPPPPAPLPPPPPAPVTPPAPAPAPEAAVSQVNPQVRRAKSKKARGEYAQGSSQLRVPFKTKRKYWSIWSSWRTYK